MAQVLKGANVTAQWYQDTYLGLLFAYLEKACLHTTETKGWPGYSGGASAPNATYHPVLREIRQHFENNRSARALRDPSSTPVRENRDRVWQLEIVAYSDYALARSVGGLWIGDLTDAHYTDIAWMLIQLNRDLGLPLASSIRWAEGQKTYVSGRRLTSSGWDACRGIATHFAVSGNTHWDAGGFFYSRLAAKIVQLLGGNHMSATGPASWDTADWAAFDNKGVTEVWTRDVDAGTTTKPAWVALWETHEMVEKLVAVPPGSTVVSGLTDESLTAIAKAVADEQARRQQA